jgi:hypothetical protein
VPDAKRDKEDCQLQRCCLDEFRMGLNQQNKLDYQLYTEEFSLRDPQPEIASMILISRIKLQKREWTEKG